MTTALSCRYCDKPATDVLAIAGLRRVVCPDHHRLGTETWVYPDGGPLADHLDLVPHMAAHCPSCGAVSQHHPPGQFPHRAGNPAGCLVARLELVDPDTIPGHPTVDLLERRRSRLFDRLTNWMTRRR